MMRVRLAVLAAFAAACPSLATAQASRFDFYARGPYRTEVPRPATLLGYEPGQFHTNYGNMERVIRAIAAAAPDRVRIIEYGMSEERRVLYLVAVSDPANIRRLDEIKAQTARLADPRNTTPADAQALSNSLPATIWLNHANDGNESAAFESALSVLYQLAASNEPATLEMLRNVVVLINPASNPESHERFVSWYNAFGTGVADHAAMEHDAPWGMSTNNNHYQIDLNRDALALTQRESRAMAAAILAWHPQVQTDHHGQTTQMFFPPTSKSMNPNLPIANFRMWEERFGRGNAEAFDRNGWQYYVRNIFDFQGPFYWDSWPSLHGAIGMTYETDGGGDLGFNWRRDDGTILTLRDGIAHHFTAALATVETLSRFKAERLRDYYDFFRSGMDDVRREPFRRVVLPADKDPRRAAELAEILLRSGVEVTRASQAFSATLAHEYAASPAGGRAARRDFPAGSYVIDLAQPQKRMARAALEPDEPMEADFLREQLARRSRNARRGADADHDGFQFYDLTAWSLPLAMGVDAYWTEDTPPVTGDRLVLPDSGDVPSQLANVGGVTGGRARSAYLFANDRAGADGMAAALMNAGFRLAVALRPLRAEGRGFPRGTFVARVERNSESLHDSIGVFARRYGVEVMSAMSAWSDSGEVGVGGEDVISLHAPRILVASGDGVREEEYGATWFLLERVMQVPFTPVRVSSISDLPNLDEYNVIIFPHGSAARYERQLGEDGVKRIADWISRGGVFIGWEGGARFAMREKVDWTSARIVGQTDDSTKSDSASQRDTVLSIDQRPGAPTVSPTAPNGARPIDLPGSIFRATLDQSHWLTFGYEAARIPVLIKGDQFVRASRAGANPVVFAGDSLTMSGWTWPNNTERLLRGSAYAVVENKGSGHVVLFADSPLYRLYFRSTWRLLQNAIVMGSSR